MSYYNFNTPEEVARKNNISQFLDGLLEENATPERTAGNLSTIFLKPDGNRFVGGGSVDRQNRVVGYDLTNRYNLQLELLKQDLIYSRKADVGTKQGLKRSKINLPAGQKRKRAYCECKFAQRRFLPESELRAFKHHSDLLKANEKNILKIPFSIHNIKHNDTLVHIYTGIPEAKGFFHLAAMFRKEHISYYFGWIVGQLTIKQQLLMTLVKLRLGLTDIHLSHRFNCSLETVTNTVYSWLFAIHEKLVGSNFQMYGILTITERMVLDSVTLHAKVPYNAQIPHKEPLESYTALILFTPGGVLTYVGNLYVWICKKVDIIQEKDFQEFLTAGDIIVVDRDIFDHNPSLPEGVAAIVFDESWEDLKYTRDDLMRRLMEYEAIKCVPSELSQYPNVVWRVIALLVNYSYLTRSTK